MSVTRNALLAVFLMSLPSATWAGLEPDVSQIQVTSTSDSVRIVIPDTVFESAQVYGSTRDVKFSESGADGDTRSLVDRVRARLKERREIEMKPNLKESPHDDHEDQDEEDQQIDPGEEGVD